MPPPNVPKTYLIPHFDKLVHFGFYFVLSGLLAPFAITKTNEMWKQGFIICLLPATFGWGVEWMQENIVLNRTFDLLDGISNSIGSVALFSWFAMSKTK